VLIFVALGDREGRRWGRSERNGDHKSPVKCALQTAAASRQPFEKRSLAPHDPGPIAGVNKQRLRIDAGRLVRNQKQRSMNGLSAGDPAADPHCWRMIGALAAFRLPSETQLNSPRGDPVFPLRRRWDGEGDGAGELLALQRHVGRSHRKGERLETAVPTMTIPSQCWLVYSSSERIGRNCIDSLRSRGQRDV